MLSGHYQRNNYHCRQNRNRTWQIIYIGVTRITLGMTQLITKAKDQNWFENKLHKVIITLIKLFFLFLHNFSF